MSKPLKTISNLHLDYIAEIYFVGTIETNDADTYVTSAQLAQRMLTSQSSVNRIIERLNDLNLVEYERYVGVKLTKGGKQQAQQILRKQSIIESFLIHSLQFEWHNVFYEAQQMRHHVSEAVLNRMWDITGNPSRSPFGEWIEPTNTQTKDITLIDAEVEKTYTIERILTREPDRLQYLAALGLIPTVRLKLLHKAPFDGPIQIQLDREYRILGNELSKMITVC